MRCTLNTCDGHVERLRRLGIAHEQTRLVSRLVALRIGATTLGLPAGAEVYARARPVMGDRPTHTHQLLPPRAWTK